MTRERSAYPVSKITIFDDLERVEVRNELEPKLLPLPGGAGNWNDSYFFAFPMNVPADGLKVMRGGQRYFDRLPDDYLPGARKDSVSTTSISTVTSGRPRPRPSYV